MAPGHSGTPRSLPCLTLAAPISSIIMFIHRSSFVHLYIGEDNLEELLFAVLLTNQKFPNCSFSLYRASNFDINTTGFRRLVHYLQMFDSRVVVQRAACPSSVFDFGLRVLISHILVHLFLFTFVSWWVVGPRPPAKPPIARGRRLADWTMHDPNTQAASLLSSLGK